MSIQVTRNRSLTERLKSRLRITAVLNKLGLIQQNVSRRFHHAALRVYYSYWYQATHPYFRQRMYGELAPLKWSNSREADFFHYLSRAETETTPHAVEPNDHILIPASKFGARTAAELISRVDDLKEYIASPQCRAILIGNDGLEQQYRHYFGDFCLHKLRHFAQMRCIPRRPAGVVAHLAGGPCVTFACLASDFHLKAVAILLDAWRRLAPTSHARLLLACSNIPDPYMAYVQQTPSITLIPKAPLSASEKRAILEQSQVSLSLTHTDGGANASEGIEWGHALITNTFHRSDYLTMNQNGCVVPFPNYAYNTAEYGIRHNSSIFVGFDEYMTLVREDYAAGRYEPAVENLALTLRRYIEDREYLRQHCLNAIDFAWNQSVWKSNSQLLDLYNAEIQASSMVG